jgi:hypothetical protein
MPSGRAARELQIIDPVLTGVARNFTPHGFAYGKVCPTIPVETISGQYPVYDDTYWFSTEADALMSDRAETPEIEFSWSTDTYLAKDYGLKASITPRERQQSRALGDPLRLERQKTRWLMKQLALRREVRLANVLRKTGTGNGKLTSGAAATAAFATSTAIEADWKTAKTTVYNLTGMVPNVAVVPYLKAYDMATNATLRDIFKYMVNSEAFIELGPGPDGETLMLPQVFHGTRLIVPMGALKQGGHEGAAKSLSEIWGTSVRFLYVDDNAAWGIPSTVYQFQHPVLSGDGRAAIPSDDADGESGPVVDRWTQNDPRKDYVRGMECVDEKVCAPDLGYELTGC